jgi:hypothetical protein
MENHRHVWLGQPPSRQEAEADLYALETLERYGITVPVVQVILSAMYTLFYAKFIDGGHSIVDEVIQELRKRLKTKAR